MKNYPFLSIFVSLAWMGALGFGVWSRSTYLVSGLALWFFVETVFWRFKFLNGILWKGGALPLSREKYLWALYRKGPGVAEEELRDRIRELKRETLEPEMAVLVRSISDLLELRTLSFGFPLEGKAGLRQAFAYFEEIRKPVAPLEEGKEDSRRLNLDSLHESDIADAACSVSEVYRRVFDYADRGKGELRLAARQLLEAVVGKNFESLSFRAWMEALTDSMQREGGIPFLVLNGIRRGNWEMVRPIAQRLLTSDIPVDEDTRVAVYWICELHGFINHPEPVVDFETTIRYLYHLCFTNPDRAGFLEIDSHFYSQFETVNELAREGFLFKETLVEKILVLWSVQDRHFDGVFQEVLQAMTQQKNKIYTSRESWESYWMRESRDFGKEHLLLVEGNICYATGHYQEAKRFYEKALEYDSQLRGALLNSLFCYAKLGARDQHERAARGVIELKSLYPTSLAVIGNSFLVAGKTVEAEGYFEELRKVEGWSTKIDYYKSTFCYEHGMKELALLYARCAFESNPTDSTVAYHLSLCYNAVGEKEQALDLLKRVGPEGPQWMNYYRFTLERDAGRTNEAHETLKQIPVDYFQDPDEYEAALEFAKSAKDLSLLRRLRTK